MLSGRCHNPKHPSPQQRKWFPSASNTIWSVQKGKATIKGSRPSRQPGKITCFSGYWEQGSHTEAIFATPQLWTTKSLGACSGLHSSWHCCTFCAECIQALKRLAGLRIELPTEYQTLLPECSAARKESPRSPCRSGGSWARRRDISG